MRLLFGADASVAAWVAQRIPHMNGEGFGPCAALGVVTEAGQPIGGVVFTGHQPQYGNIMVSMAADSSKWLTKPLITAILRYPFKQLGVVRVTALTPPGETSVGRFLEKFGWKREGVIRQGLGDQDAWIWGLLASEWKWSRFNLDRPVEQPPAKKRRRRRRKGTLSLHEGIALH